MIKNLFKIAIRHIRKHFGYSLLNILGLTFGISIIIAVPVAYYFMSNWLKNFVYRTNIGISLLSLAALLTVLITFITISYKAYQAAILNPASSLKTE